MVALDGGKLGDKVNEIAESSTRSQTEYKVVPVFKGQYDESMAAAIAAYRSGNPPQIVQVFEVGTATMMAAKGAIKPVYQIMAEQHEQFDPKAYLPAVTAYYSDTKGNLLSMPFNSSTQVLYINKDAFKKAGLDPSKAPRTWPDMAKAAEKLKASGAACALRPAGSRGCSSKVSAPGITCRSRPGERLRRPGHAAEFNGPVQVKHIQKLGDWAKKDFHLCRPQGRAARQVHERRVRA